MKKRTPNIKFIGFLGIILVVIVVFLIISDKTNYKTTLYDSYAAAEQSGKEDLGKSANVIKVFEIQGDPDNASIIVYLRDDLQTVYISLIEKDKKGFRYSRVSPTFNIGSRDETNNVAYEIEVPINSKKYFVSIGRVEEAYKVFNNDDELMIGVDRIFIAVNASEKNQIKFVENMLLN